MSALGSFALGIMIGTALGVFAAGLCHVASDMEDVKRSSHNEPPQA